MKITIAKKIALPFIVIFILLVGMSAITYQGFQRINAAVNDIELEGIKQKDAGNLRFGITQLLMPANDFIITGRNQYKDEFDSLLQIVNKNLTAFSHRSLTRNEKQLLHQIKNGLDSITSYSKQIFSIPEPRKSLTAVQLMEIMDYRFGTEVNKKTTQIFNGISKRVEEYRLQTAEVKENAAKALFGGTLISILIGIIVAFLSVRKISRPIISVAKAAVCIAHGDYSCRPIPKTNDEIALLANSFNKMAASIQRSQKEQAEFKTILYSIGDGVITTNNAGVIKLMNLVAERLTGLSESDAKGRLLEDIIQIVNEVTQKKVENPVERVLSIGMAVGLANHAFLISKDGKEIPVAVNGAPIRDGQGEIEGVVLIFRDKTEEHKTEKLIRQSETRLKRAEFVSKTGNWELHLDTKTIIASEGAAKIYGVRGSKFDYSSIKQFSLPEYRPLLDESIRSLIENDMPYDVEFKIKNPETGEIVHLHSVAEYDKVNKIIFGVIQDITENKKAEAAIRESEERFRSVTQSANDAIVSADSKGIIIDWNPGAEKIFGYSKEKIIGKNLETIIPQSYRDLHNIQLERTSLGGEHHIIGKTVEMYGLHISGKEFPIELSLAEWQTSKGKFFSGIIRDISERKKAETEIKLKNEQLQKTDSEKNKFFSIIAHDLRSPFSGFLNLTEIMAKEHEDFSKVELVEFGKSLYESASTVYKLLENLLEWAQMQKGTISFTPGELLLFNAVSSSINTINQRALQKGISIINEVYDTQKVYADEKMINTILRNFLSNAVKFTKQGGQIIIRAKKLDDEMVEVSVSDTGVGMAEKDVNKLFKLEEKVSSKGTEGEPSTGLGLLLCKEFIEKNGGKVRVESEKGKGSIFYFTVPESNDKNN